MNQLENKILEISKRHKLSHIGSCISVLPILVDIYQVKQPDDFVVLSGAHAHLAHLVVMEKYKLVENIEVLLEKYGIHCDRKAGCDVSGGSLGHAGGNAIGLALANPQKTVYWVTTDGALEEGSEWEALQIIQDLGISNIQIHVNMNGYTAVKELTKAQRVLLEFQLQSFAGDYCTIWNTKNGEGFEGVQGHYKTI